MGYLLPDSTLGRDGVYSHPDGSVGRRATLGPAQQPVTRLYIGCQPAAWTVMGYWMPNSIVGRAATWIDGLIVGRDSTLAGGVQQMTRWYIGSGTAYSDLLGHSLTNCST